MKKITQPKIKSFIALCEEMLIDEFGAEKTELSLSYNLVINTRIGKLFLRVDSGPYTYALFGNFIENVEEAKREFMHWKYNTHVSSEHQPEEAVEFIRQKTKSFYVDYFFHNFLVKTDFTKCTFHKLVSESYLDWDWYLFHGVTFCFR